MQLTPNLFVFPSLCAFVGAMNGRVQCTETFCCYVGVEGFKEQSSNNG
jgi:hypothetical protein